MHGRIIYKKMRFEKILCISAGILCLFLVISCTPAVYPEEDYWTPDNSLNISHSDKVFLMHLAKQTVEDYFSGRETILDDENIPRNIKGKDNRIYVTIRNNGEERACYSTKKQDLASTTIQATLNAVEDARYGGVLEEAEQDNITIELTILYNEQVVDSKRLAEMEQQIELGVHAIKISNSNTSATFIASVPIVHNYDFEYNLNRLCKKAGLEDGCYKNEDVFISKFEVYHFINKDGFDDVQDLYRSNIYFDVYDVKKETVRESIDLAGEWMLNHLNEDGSLNYKYEPSTDSYPDQNNMIRQTMGTWSLARLYTFTKDKKYLDAWNKNMQYNLDNYYVEDQEHDFGYILFDDKAKLGSAAFMLASILETKNPKYEEEKQKLINFIYYLQQDEGYFRTFYIPADRNDNQYYYPGEALLAMMLLYEQTKDKEILKKVDKSFYFYREYFYDTMNPAFVPWQTQAYYKAYLATGKQEYADFVFEMNDWLVDVMVWDSLEPYPDYLGRYYSAEHPDYGPSHAASTSVYIEGLSDAFKLAKKSGDTERAEKYRNAIILGIRSTIELQYGAGTMFYIENKDKARGGIRTTVTDNSIRIDNTQHSIMAFINIYDAFGENDYLFDEIIRLES